MQEGKEHKYRERNCFYCKEYHIKGDKEKCNDYRKQLDIVNEMIEEKFDAYEEKGIPGSEKEIYAVVSKENKREKT